MRPVLGIESRARLSKGGLQHWWLETRKTAWLRDDERFVVPLGGGWVARNPLALSEGWDNVRLLVAERGFRRCAGASETAEIRTLSRPFFD